MARVRINKRGEIVLTISVYEARMTGDALGETIHRHELGMKGGTGTVLRAVDRGIARAQSRPAPEGSIREDADRG